MTEDETTTPLGAESTPAHDSKLSPKQQEQVRSAEFITWFGDWQNNPNGPETSKIVDTETGEPCLYYHGTNRTFSLADIRPPIRGQELSNSGGQHDHDGIYLSASEAFATQYADHLGAGFDSIMYNLISRFGKKDWKDGFEIWNDLIKACQEKSDRVAVIEGERRFSLDEVADAIKDGRLDYSSPFEFDGKPIAWVGEFLQDVGGEFPRPDEELVPYRSLYPRAREVVQYLEAQGLPLLVPQHMEPRIIPVFVKSVKPLAQDAKAIRQGMDFAFRAGLDEIAAHPEVGYDSIIAEDDGSVSGTNMLVFQGSQLQEAHN